MKLEGKTFVVIGGTSGIGLAAAAQAHALGAKVFAYGRSEDRVAEASNQYPEIQFTSCDIHDQEALKVEFEKIGRIDYLVSAATGANRTIAPFLEQTPEQFSAAFDKFWGYCNAIRTAAPFLAEDASITLVSGSPARKCNPGMSSISCVGNAVEGLVRALAVEIAPRRINVVAPGVIETGMYDHFGDNKSAVMEQMGKNILLGRVGTSEEVAEAILLAASNPYMTGSTIDVDGGTLLP